MLVVFLPLRVSLGDCFAHSDDYFYCAYSEERDALLEPLVDEARRLLQEALRRHGLSWTVEPDPDQDRRVALRLHDADGNPLDADYDPNLDTLVFDRPKGDAVVAAVRAAFAEASAAFDQRLRQAVLQRGGIVQTPAAPA